MGPPFRAEQKASRAWRLLATGKPKAFSTIHHFELPLSAPSHIPFSHNTFSTSAQNYSGQQWAEAGIQANDDSGH